jgi:hypothetical protein
MALVTVDGGSSLDVNTLMDGMGITKKDILAKRILQTDPNAPTDEAGSKAAVDKIKGNLSDNSPALIAIDQEINSANAMLKTTMNNVSLLSTPITAPSAAMTIGGLLPDLLKMLGVLGVLDSPILIAAITPITGLITAIAEPIKAINSAIAVFGIPELIPAPPSITIDWDKA